MSDDYNETYWRNRGGEGRAPWNDPSPDAYPKRPEPTDNLDKVFEAYQDLAKEAVEESALDTQVGGRHYKDYDIQPIEYIQKNALGFIEGSIVKYITRYEEKGGANDLDKIIHYCELLKELKYGK